MMRVSTRPRITAPPHGGAWADERHNGIGAADAVRLVIPGEGIPIEAGAVYAFARRRAGEQRRVAYERWMGRPAGPGWGRA